MSIARSSGSKTPARKRSHWPAALYWSTFILCAGASFGAGFWFTYRYTSQVGIRGPQTGVAPPPILTSNPIAVATPNSAPTPEDLFAAAPTATPAPISTPTEAPTAEPTPQTQPAAGTEDPTPTAEPESTPEPTPTPDDVYRVQVGSYDSREAAESMVQELLSAGIQAVVVFDQVKYHAQVGAYNSKESALAVADEVNAKGYTVTIRH